MQKTYPSPHSLSLFLVVTILLSLRIAIGDPRYQVVEISCGKQQQHNTTAYSRNFVATMEIIRYQILTDGFGTAVTGRGPDASYALAQCHEDLSLDDCELCYSEARKSLPLCNPSNAGRVYLDGCFARAANYSFFQEYSGLEDKAVCGNTTMKNRMYQESARRAIPQAVSSAQNNKGYARAQVTVSGTGNESAYVLADCWKSLSMSDCKACLDNASSSILGCLPWSEGRALNTGCFMRYSDKDFINKETGGGISRGTQIVIAVSVISSVLVLGIIVRTCVRKHGRIQKKRKERSQLGTMLAKKSKLRFSYETLEKATNYFNDSNKLGQGGSASVYKGILPDGKTVAIKRLFFDKQWASHLFNEVDLISRLHHKNVVMLLGYSVIGPESLLVYEYAPNGSLQDHIFSNRNSEPLRWGLRYNIILGTAKGLAYLHEESNARIIHRDIKLGNILLDEDFTAKIADFGLARLFPEDKSHVNTAMAGTFGYMAPEYLTRGKLTEKVDVYGFGFLVIEVVSGRRSNSISQNAIITLKKIWELYGSGRLCEAVDPVLEGDFREEKVSRVLQIALLCVQASAKMRPTMSMVVKMLLDDFEIPRPTEPPFLNLYRSAEIGSSIPPSTDSTEPES